MQCLVFFKCNNFFIFFYVIFFGGNNEREREREKEHFWCKKGDVSLARISDASHLRSFQRGVFSLF